MYCCKCLREEKEDGCVNLKMYKVPRIEYGKSPMGSVTGWDIYCEECVEDYLEEYRTGDVEDDIL